MEPKVPKFNLPTPKAYVLQNKGQEEEVTTNCSPNKLKVSSLSNDSSSSENPKGASDPITAKSYKINFSCEFCGKTFSCYRGLNGHQNAHKNKRVFAMGGKNMNVNGPGLAPNSNNCNQEYFFHREPYYKTLKSPTQNFSQPIIPMFLEPYYRHPYFAPHGLGFHGWNSTKVNPPLPYAISQKVPILNVNHAPINAMPQINSKVYSEINQDQELGAGRSNRKVLIYYAEDSGINNIKSDSQDELLDLTLKL